MENLEVKQRAEQLVRTLQTMKKHGFRIVEDADAAGLPDEVRQACAKEVAVQLVGCDPRTNTEEVEQVARELMEVARDRLEFEGSGDLQEAVRRDEASLKTSYRKLDVIRRALRGWQAGTASPRSGLAQAVAFVVVLALVAVGIVVDALHLVRIDTKTVLETASVAGLCAWAAVRFMSRLPTTHSEHLDRLLTDYQPVSAQAFRDLQASVKQLGRLDVNELEQWAVLEYSALGRVAARVRRSDDAGFAFLQRSI